MTHPDLGYYTRKEKVIGGSGDFITSPELTPVFGELCGIWAIYQWQQMGKPEKVSLVELGPGKGTLMKDMLRIAKKFPDFFNAVEIHLIERSKLMMEQQKQTLYNFNKEISWHADVELVPDQPMLLIGQEYLDALPVHQFQYTKK